MAGELFARYADEFVEKVFYFCLKKCSNPTQAEDLAGEINCQVLGALHRDHVPDNFPAWVWAIARNQYSKWAIQNKKRRESLLPDDIGEYDVADGAGVEAEILQSEQVKLLRRELAFVASEYREILIAYYIDGKKTEQIAKSLNLPRGTVVSKLHRIRKKLKEGFDMSREFGERSYNPENVGFIMNGSDSRDGAPWSFFQRMIPKNLMLAAYRNPMTAEDLAIELGLALPYMEDELDKLVRATLMAKQGDKYQTAIFIVSAKAQERCGAHLDSMIGELTEWVIKSAEFRAKCSDQNGARWHEGYQDFEDMKWMLLMWLLDELELYVTRKHRPARNDAKIGHNGRTLRPGNGQWDVLGLEDCDAHAPFVGLHGSGETLDGSNSGYHYYFGQYKFNYEKINDKTPVHLSNELCRALVDCARKTPEHSPAILLDQLVDDGYLVREEQGYRPTFLVQFRGPHCELTSEQKAQDQQLTAPAVALLEGFYQVCREAVLQEVPVALRDDEHQITHAIENLMFPRGAVLQQALATGWLTYDKSDPDSARRRMLGAYLLID